MWIDHLTLAVHQISALDDVLSDLGLLRRDAPPLFDGTERGVIPLSQGFLELVSVVTRQSVRRFALGRAFLRFMAGGEGFWRVVVGVADLDRFVNDRAAVGARYWPPIDESLTGIADAPLPVRITQIDPLLPWVMDYRTSYPPCGTEDGVRWDVLDVQSPSPAMTAVQFRMALGHPVAAPPPGGIPAMHLENSAFRFVYGADAGLKGVRLVAGNRRAAIVNENGTLSATVARI